MSDSRKKNNAIILSLIVVYVFAYFIFIFRCIPNYAIITNGIFVIGLTVISYLMYGFQNCSLNKIRKKVLIEVFISILVYFILIYCLGFLAGFLKNSYSSNGLSIIKNCIVPLISMVVLEIFRYIFVSANRDSKELITYGTMAIIALDIVLNFYHIESTLVAVFIYLTVKVLPIIFKNIVMSYLTYQVGFHSCILYVIPLCLFKYIVPYIPNLGNYLYAVIDITLPSMIFIYASRMISDNLREKENTFGYLKIIFFDIPLIFIFSLCIGLISDIFDYQIVGVNTSAISPKVKRGDAVMIEKAVRYENYKEGDIIVYKSDDDLIIDKITKKDKDEDGKVRLYITYEYNKGEEDTYKEIGEEILLGKYNKFRIGKIAYPTIWFNDFIKGDVHEN